MYWYAIDTRIVQRHGKTLLSSLALIKSLKYYNQQFSIDIARTDSIQ